MWQAVAVTAAVSAVAVPSVAAKPAPRAGGQGEPVIHYTIRQGDTLSELAQRYLGPGRDWHDLGRAWRVGDPRHLPTGRIFTIPRTWLRWNEEKARVVSVRGTVSVQQGAASLRAAPGVMLAEGTNIVTGANSYATLVLVNGSRVALPSHSAVTIVRLRKYALNETIEYRFRVDRGLAETRDPPLKNPDSEFTVRTPMAMTAVRGTEFAVSFEPSQRETGTAVFEGAVAVSASDGSREQLVAERFGAVTVGDGNSRQLPLLPAPDMNDPGRTQADDLVTFDIQPLAGATVYQAQLARDAGFVDWIDEQVSATPRFEFSGVPNGTLFVRISAVGPGNLGGMRQSYAFTRHLASIRGEAQPGDDGYTFRWFGSGEGERHYRLQIFREDAPGRAVVDEAGLTRSEAVIRNLRPGVYTWRVGVTQTDEMGSIQNWSSPERLTIGKRGG